MTPLSRYKKDLQRPDFNYDVAQENAVKELQNLYERIIASDSVPFNVFSRIFKKKTKEVEVGAFIFGAE